MDELSGQTVRGWVALVTGAGRGIGAATAAALAAAGASVAVLARSTDEIARVAARLRDAGHASSGVTCDVGDPAAVRAAVAQVERGLGPVDVLINNAGVVAPLGPTAEIDVQAWAAALAINLTGAFACIQAVLPGTRARRWGRSVNVSTGAATGRGLRHANAYSVSKAGLEMLTANLAAALAGTGVTVNAVRPGVVESAMQASPRAQSPARVGDAFVAPFRRLKDEGQLLDARVPAQVIAARVAHDSTGDIISVDGARGTGATRTPATGRRGMRAWTTGPWAGSIDGWGRCARRRSW